MAADKRRYNAKKIRSLATFKMENVVKSDFSRRILNVLFFFSESGVNLPECESRIFETFIVIVGTARESYNSSIFGISTSKMFVMTHFIHCFVAH